MRKKYQALEQIDNLTKKITYLNEEADKIRQQNQINDKRDIKEELKPIAYKTYELLSLIKAINHDKIFDEKIINLELLLDFLGARVAK
jgi:hypothetical protein